MRRHMQFLCPLAVGFVVLFAGPSTTERNLLPPDRQIESGADQPTSGYEAVNIEGWTVLVNRGLLERKRELANRALNLLRFQLYQVTRSVPPVAVKKLRTIRIWVEERETHHPCMCYHPNVRWLQNHGLNPEKAGCVEIANVENFLDWTLRQPWMVLHEMSHGYHQKFIRDGYQNRAIRAAYEHAMNEGLYDRVLRANGREVKAYAATDDHEYFAEATEAFFGTNDFFPFVQAELRRHDPMAFKVLQEAWGVQPEAPN